MALWIQGYISTTKNSHCLQKKSTEQPDKNHWKIWGGGRAQGSSQVGLTPQNVLACLIPLSSWGTTFSKVAAELQKHHLSSPHSLSWAAIWSLLCLQRSWQDAEGKKKKKKTPRYLCIAWIYGEVRKCIFHVSELPPWPCEATAVLVHKQHEQWVIASPKDQSSSPGGAFVFPFMAAPEASQPSLPMACALLTCDLLTIITGRAICNQTYNKDILVLRGSDNAPFSNFCAVSNLENEW